MSETKSFEELFLAQSIDETLKVKHLKILLLSNINSNNLFLFKLKEFQIEKNIYFDYLFFLGNFLSFSIEKDKNNLKEIANEEAEIGGLLSNLENLCLNVIYIGGINDCITLFKKPFPNLTIKSKNIHRDFFKLSDDLYVVGYGGYIDNDKLEETFYSLHKYIKLGNRMKNFQTILINNDNYKDDIFSTKSKRKNILYEKIFKNKNNNIFMNINGNNNIKEGVYNLYDIKIINPGCLDKGNIAILDLERDIKNNFWKIQNIEYLLI